MGGAEKPRGSKGINLGMKTQHRELISFTITHAGIDLSDKRASSTSDLIL